MSNTTSGGGAGHGPETPAARRAYAMRRRGTLKEAVTELIGAVGGLERAAALTRVSPSTLQKYSSPNEEHEQRHMPVDVVRALEAAAGRPVVTRFLAAELGCTIERIGGDAVDCLGEASARAIHEAADVSAVTVKALADGVIEQHEADDIAREVDEAIEALQRVRDGARAAVRGEGT